jgi:CheY-like chemotaxis protein
MPRVTLIHWKAEEARQKAAAIRAAGHTVSYQPFGPKVLHNVKQKPPAAIVIDLTRQPMQGRDVAIAIRHAKSTRLLPIVFVEGDPEKVERIKSQVPDAVYTTWGRIRSGLKRAITRPPKDPVVPQSVLAGYSGTPLPKKLGIKPDSVVTLVDAPKDFERTLGKLPNGVTLKRQARGRPDLTLWFVASQKDLDRKLPRILPMTEQGGALWIVWPKKSSGVPSDLTQADVRSVGLASGLVDFKVCAVDETWSGLKFVRRKQGGGKVGVRS